MAAVLLATSCSKDDENNSVIDNVVAPQEETIQDAGAPSVKTITITGKVSQASLSKVTVEGRTLKFEYGEGGDEFKFGNGKSGDSKVEGSIKFTSADGDYSATFTFKDEDELTAAAGFSTSINEPTKDLSDAKDNLAAAVKAAHYTIDFTVEKDGDSYKLKSGAASDIVVEIQSAFIQALSDATSQMGGEGISVDAGKYYVVPVGKTMGSGSKTTAAGKIYRLGKPQFTVDADGKAVEFSKGNLQYDADAGKYQFATNQWDCIGNVEANENCTGTFDLFCWGTGDNPAQANVIVSASDFKDWGDYIEAENNWFTLSNAQWSYLLETRGGTQYSKAKVHGVQGLVILPDNWNGTYAFATTNTSNAEFDEIADADWTTLEKEGAVFLPAAG